jgi:hypothetical protein
MHARRTRERERPHREKRQGGGLRNEQAGAEPEIVTGLGDAAQDLAASGVAARADAVAAHEERGTERNDPQDVAVSRRERNLLLEEEAKGASEAGTRERRHGARAEQRTVDRVTPDLYGDRDHAAAGNLQPQLDGVERAEARDELLPHRLEEDRILEQASRLVVGLVHEQDRDGRRPKREAEAYGSREKEPHDERHSPLSGGQPPACGAPKTVRSR